MARRTLQFSSTVVEDLGSSEYSRRGFGGHGAKVKVADVVLGALSQSESSRRGLGMSQSSGRRFEGFGAKVTAADVSLERREPK